MSEYPAELRYTKEHEWTRVEGNIAIVGVTAFAVEQLGDVTMVELPTEGDTITKDDVFGTVESVKTVSDLFSPVSGKILKINSPLHDSPEYVNEAPYDEGWLIHIEMSDATELTATLTADEYRALVAQESA